MGRGSKTQLQLGENLNYLQIFGLKLSKINMGNFHSIEVVGRRRETQFQLGENLNYLQIFGLKLSKRVFKGQQCFIKLREKIRNSFNFVKICIRIVVFKLVKRNSWICRTFLLRLTVRQRLRLHFISKANCSNYLLEKQAVTTVCLCYGIKCKHQ